MCAPGKTEKEGGITFCASGCDEHLIEYDSIDSFKDLERKKERILNGRKSASDSYLLHKQRQHMDDRIGFQIVNRIQLRITGPNK